MRDAVAILGREMHTQFIKRTECKEISGKSKEHGTEMSRGGGGGGRIEAELS